MKYAEIGAMIVWTNDREDSQAVVISSSNLAKVFLKKYLQKTYDADEKEIDKYLVWHANYECTGGTWNMGVFDGSFEMVKLIA